MSIAKFQKLVYSDNGLNYFKEHYFVKNKEFYDNASWDMTIEHKYLYQDVFSAWCKKANNIVSNSMNGSLYLKGLKTFGENSRAKYGTLYGSARFVFEELANKENAKILVKNITNSNEEIENVNFEFANKINSLRTPSQLDCVITTKGHVICIEAKMQEIYGKGKEKHIMSGKYYKIIQDFVGKEDSNHYKRNGDVVVLNNGKKSNFDLKQFICHILGIANNYDEKFKGKKVHFIYFIFEPNAIDTNNETKCESEFSEFTKNGYGETKDWMNFIGDRLNRNIIFNGFYNQNFEKIENK